MLIFEAFSLSVHTEFLINEISYDARHPIYPRNQGLLFHGMNRFSRPYLLFLTVHGFRLKETHPDSY